MVYFAFLIYHIIPPHVKLLQYIAMTLKIYLWPEVHPLYAHVFNNLIYAKYDYLFFFIKSPKIPFVINSVFTDAIQKANLEYTRLYSNFSFLLKSFSCSEQIQTTYLFTINSMRSASSQFTFQNFYHKCGYLNFPQNPIFTKVVESQHLFNSLTNITFINYRSSAELYMLAAYTNSIGLTRSMYQFIESIKWVDYNSFKVAVHQGFNLNSLQIPQVWQHTLYNIADGQYINTNLISIPLPPNYSNNNLFLSAVSTSSLATMKTTTIYYTAGMLVAQYSLLCDLLEWELLLNNCNICRYKLLEIPLPWDLLFTNTEKNYLLYKNIKPIGLQWNPHVFRLHRWLDWWIDYGRLEPYYFKDHETILTLTYVTIVVVRHHHLFQNPFIFF